MHLLTNRAFRFAVRFADRRGDPGLGPEHLLYGALQDAQDPVGTHLSRRDRRRLADLGLTPGRPNPLQLLLDARGVDLTHLATALAAVE